MVLVTVWETHVYLCWPVDSREIFTIENIPKIKDRLLFFLVVILYKNYSGNFQSKRMKFTVLNS